MDMNTAALAVKERAEAKADKDYDTFAPRIMDDLVDDLMRGESIGKVRGLKVDLAFVLDGEGFIEDWEAAKLVRASMEERNDMFLQIEKRAKQRCALFLQGVLGAEIVEDKVREAIAEQEEE